MKQRLSQRFVEVELSAASRRVADALVWLDHESSQTYDIILVDFPDPNNFSLGKLYTTWFYHLLQKAMHDQSVVSIQSTSPLLARKSYWCVVQTLEATGMAVQPYHALVPSFGEWGYALVKKRPFAAPTKLDVEGLRYLNHTTLRAMFSFAEDSRRPHYLAGGPWHHHASPLRPQSGGASHWRARSGRFADCRWRTCARFRSQAKPPHTLPGQARDRRRAPFRRPPDRGAAPRFSA